MFHSSWAAIRRSLPISAIGVGTVACVSLIEIWISLATSVLATGTVLRFASRVRRMLLRLYSGVSGCVTSIWDCHVLG